MAALSMFALVATLYLGGRQSGGGVARWTAEIDAAAARCAVPAAWIAQVMRAESAGQTHVGGRPIRSSKGAIGLMQLMPGTWAALRRDLSLGPDPDLPRDNIVAGACYLRQMYDRFGHPGLFGAYNAGPGRYAAWLAGNATLPAETIGYLRKMGGAGTASAPSIPAPAPGIFVLRREGVEATQSASAAAAPSALFVVRREVP